MSLVDLTQTNMTGLPVNGRTHSLKKADDELRIVWGEVYAPGFPDSQGDFMSSETIRDMAYGFMKNQALSSIDTNHDHEKNGSMIVESFIAREDDTIFIPDSWVIGVHVPEDDVWELVKSGELNGFSIDGKALGKVEALFEISMPDTLAGETDVGTDGHKHIFYVKFDKEGTFLGGETDRHADGHFHKIKMGTCTEVSNDHSHRFSFVEGILDAQLAA